MYILLYMPYCVYRLASINYQKHREVFPSLYYVCTASNWRKPVEHYVSKINTQAIHSWYNVVRREFVGELQLLPCPFCYVSDVSKLRPGKLFAIFVHLQ